MILLTKTFDYFLPKELIAQEPLQKRDSSRLLVFDKKSGMVKHEKFSEIEKYVNAGDALVFNDTRVMPARLMGKREKSQSRVEVFLLNELEGNNWEVLVKPGKKARTGEKINFSSDFYCTVKEVTDSGSRIVSFNSGLLSKPEFINLLNMYGEMPLPPYIETKLTDKERYQTIYANKDKEKSVAAPTAGLHFTKELISCLEQKGVKIVYSTLHVGLGTFRPVKAESILEHEMHKEYYSLTEDAAETLNKARESGKKIIAVGTTAVRVLETVAGRNNGKLAAACGWTDIFIYPQYEFKYVSAMVTNFHLPKSTLLMLVCAFAGTENILRLYNEAVNKKYRFFSFGDAMLLL